jgi:putative alpha-1,2-mannosidase
MNNGVDNKYIQYAELNGQLLERPFFTHAELEEGGILKLQMGPEPNLTWGYKDE